VLRGEWNRRAPIDTLRVGYFYAITQPNQIAE